MRIVFMGTPDFAVPCLQKILDSHHQVVGVFSQPDKPKGRGYVLTPPPVKELALQYNLPVYQPATLKDGTAMEILRELAPEIIVVVAYGKILRKEVLDLPKYGCINIHGSILPKYRGAAPIQWTVLNGETETGVTSMLLDEGVDTGDMLGVKTTAVGENETAGELFDRLSALGADLLMETLEQIENGTAQRTPQDHAAATHTTMLDKNMSEVDWSRTAQEIHNQVRGLSPWPSAHTVLDGKKLKLHQTRKTELSSDRPAGTVISNEPLQVVCGDSKVLTLTEIQYEGGKRMASADFLRGHKIPVGTILG